MKIILTNIFFLFLFSNSSAQIIYVNQSATGNNDGTSWENAFTELSMIYDDLNYGDTIWVAAGTYRPSQGNNRIATFQIVNGVRMFGGFVGNETNIQQRDYEVNLTVLSGDIGVLGDSTDNSYNVMRCTFADSTTVVDGFTITEGNADGDLGSSTSFLKNGGGLYFANNDEEEEAIPKIRNCTFLNNTSSRNGGGIYVRSEEEEKSIVRLINCIFDGNVALIGGGLYVENTGNLNEHLISHCALIGNYGKSSGSGFSFEYKYGIQKIRIFDSVFEKNLTNPFGTNIYIDRKSGNVEVSFESCTFLESELKLTPSGLIVGYESSFETEGFLISFRDCFFQEVRNADLLLSFNTVSYLFKNCIFQLLPEDMGNVDHIIRAEGNTYTIYENNLATKSSQDIEFLRFQDVGSSYESNFRIVNSLFEGFNGIRTNVLNNSITVNGSDNFFIQGESLSLSNNLFNIPFTDDYFDIDNITLSQNNLFSTDPLFRDTANGDYTLLPCSPARDAGDSSLVDLSMLPTDLAGNPRVQGSQIDIGPYETAPFAIATTDFIPPACTGDTAVITLSLDRGCPPFTIVYNGVTSMTDSTEVVFATIEEEASIIITDSRQESDTVLFQIPEPVPLTATAQTTDVDCTTGQGGSIDLQVTGGTGSYHYQWNSVADTTAAIADLAADIYLVSITDDNDCILTDTIAIGRTGLLSVSQFVSVISCPGGADAETAAVPTSGVAPYTYLWNTGSQDDTLTGLGAGTYIITITDAFGCTGSDQVTLGTPDSIEVMPQVNSLGCLGQSNSNITLVTTGGNAPYDYFWSNDQWGATQTNLSGGDYTITIVDDNDCEAIATVTVTPSPYFEATLIGDSILCPDESTTIAPVLSGATPFYTYAWSTGSTDSLLTIDTDGTYTVTISDSAGCDTILLQNIVGSPEITIESTITNNTDLLTPNGIIVLSDIPSDYTFLWNTGSTDASLNNLPAGTYSVTVTDGNGCVEIFEFEVDFVSSTSEGSDKVSMSIIPNPASAATAAVLVFDAPLMDNQPTLQITDVTGQSIAVIRLEKGIQKVPLPLDLPVGMYLVRILAAGKNSGALKWVVQ